MARLRTHCAAVSSLLRTIMTFPPYLLLILLISIEHRRIRLVQDLLQRLPPLLLHLRTRIVRRGRGGQIVAAVHARVGLGGDRADAVRGSQVEGVFVLVVGIAFAFECSFSGGMLIRSIKEDCILALLLN
ncbi:hypothetical protein V8E36_001180 [Tilletia maclaganii]